MTSLMQVLEIKYRILGGKGKGAPIKGKSQANNDESSALTLFG